LIIGENVCGMDPETRYTNGMIVHSPELERRVKRFREFWDEKYGHVVIQTNIEDQRTGVDIYAISKLEINIIKRGQGAKAIGGEVRIKICKRHYVKETWIPCHSRS